jgi:hypothetical protein
MATHIWGNGMEFENPLVVTVDNKIIYETVIGGEEDMKLYDQVQDGALDKANAKLKNIKFVATAGPHKVGVAFKRRTFAESDDQLQQFAPGGGQDRFYRVNSFQIRGPFNIKGVSATPSRERIFTCHPAADATAPVKATCARQILSTLAKRAYRRPVTAEDVNELMQYYQDGIKTAASTKACAARSRACWPVRSSCIAPSMCPRGCAPVRRMRSATRARLEPFVLPVEHDSGCGTAPGGDRREAERRDGARSAGEAHAGRPAVDHAGGQLHAAVARHEAPRRDRAGLVGVSVRVGSIRSA